MPPASENGRHSRTTVSNHLRGWWELDSRVLRREIESKVEAMRGWKVAVLYGPTSLEDETYLRNKARDQLSVTDILRGLGQLGIHSEWIDPTRPDLAQALQGFDAAFLNTHGSFGEDGHLQGLLAYLGVPYTGSTVASSGIACDKRLTKLILQDPRIARLPHQRVTLAQEPGDVVLEGPSMLKATHGGSSIGIALVRDRCELDAAFRQCIGAGFTDFIVEPFIAGTAMTVPAMYLDGQPIMLPPLICATDGTYYDAPSKLAITDTCKVEFTPLTDPEHDRTRALLEAMLAITSTLNFDGIIRADFLACPGQAPIFLEVNTLPGVQRNSNLMLSAKAIGLTEPEVLAVILASAMNRGKIAPWRLPASCPAQPHPAAPALWPGQAYLPSSHAMPHVR